GGEITVETGLGLGSLDVIVWADTDGDGSRDGDEVPIPGVAVTVTFTGPDAVMDTADDLMYTATTDGMHTFDQVPIGQPYEVRVDPSTLPAGYEASFDPDGVLDNSTTGVIGGVNHANTLNFGYRPSPPPTKPTPDPPENPVLAFTGTETGLLVTFALLLITLGGLVLGAQTRQRRSIGGNPQ
ncbi:MAG: hypothetical protein OER95_09265, partial [Acidimicrobiia bacterium]|nr:hypothetical protein [Acidimicrobiia bacterium]